MQQEEAQVDKKQSRNYADTEERLKDTKYNDR
jgi:hypothetical protein